MCIRDRVRIRPASRGTGRCRGTRVWVQRTAIRRTASRRCAGRVRRGEPLGDPRRRRRGRTKARIRVRRRRFQASGRHRRCVQPRLDRAHRTRRVRVLLQQQNRCEPVGATHGARLSEVIPRKGASENVGRVAARARSSLVPLRPRRHRPTTRERRCIRSRARASRHLKDLANRSSE